MAQLSGSNSTDFCIDGDNNFKITISGGIKAHAEANVFFMTASFNFELELKTAVSIELESHKNGIDLVLCHDGIVLKFQFTADVSLRTKKDDSAFYEGAPLDADWTIYQFADPLALTESDIRFNLAGQVRKVPERQRPELATLTSAVNAVPTSIAGAAIKNTFEKG
ncbi:hypothetical protein [Providencia rettgeri]|uniref:hypothetical protein n=1 Tax=Providencia rettgeri TaxID=587 RepID=UPI0025A7B238|nr:hypothetical protein [Providencia rettgeri]ELR5222195.1 hypothetical protein [Providencia rettgeri]MDX7324126.1 hypothetical protein [Providencia rettgeri]